MIEPPHTEILAVPVRSQIRLISSLCLFAREAYPHAPGAPTRRRSSIHGAELRSGPPRQGNCFALRCLAHLSDSLWVQIFSHQGFQQRPEWFSCWRLQNHSLPSHGEALGGSLPHSLVLVH